MIKMRRLILFCCCLYLLWCVDVTIGKANDFEHRREQLLEMLTSPAMLEGDIDSLGYSYRRRWQHYHACLAHRVNLEAANRYFAESDEIIAEEWQILLFLRTYFSFKESGLNKAARKRLADVIQSYKVNAPNSRGIERYGVKGNHSIVAFSMYLLCDQEFGHGPKHDLVREKFIEWVRHQGRFGRDEVNSPHYLERSLLPLLNLYDFIEDRTLKRWSRMAIDQMMIDFALLSLDNVRGGPWCRAHHHHSPGVEEINNGTQDSFYVAGYLYFGGSAFPSYPFTDQILSYGFLVTTFYRPPPAVLHLAQAANRGAYEVRSHRSPVKGSLLTSRQEWDMYYYMTPRYCLAALQDRMELDNHLTNRATKPADYVNTQVWELTFSDPMKILGPKRRLDVSTSGKAPRSESDNPNTANMQYRNVLFYKGEFMDYNGNLSSSGGAYHTKSAESKAFHFWHVQTPEGPVFVGATHFPSARAGILEIRLGDDYPTFKAFTEDIEDNFSICQDTGLQTTYLSTVGDRIQYEHGKATVNGKDWPLHDYKLYESPYIQSDLGSGVIEITQGTKSLNLDFRNKDKPVRVER